MKRLICALAAVAVLCVPAFALSNSEYLKMKKDSAFNAADGHLTRAYNQAKSSMSTSDFEKLKREQRQWIAEGRDKEAKRLMRNGFDKPGAYTDATLNRAREIYSKIPLSSVSQSVRAEDFIGTYYNGNYVCMTIWREDREFEKKRPKGVLSVGFSIPRINGPDLFGRPRGNILEAEFDYDNDELMALVKYESGIKKEGNLDIRARLIMLNKYAIKVEASPDLDSLFGTTSGIFLREEEDE